MAVLEGRIRPIQWETLHGAESASPPWLSPPSETLYETFRLLQPAADDPVIGAIMSYGDAVLTAAFGDVDGLPFPRWLRRIATALKTRGVTLCDVDLIAMPRDGGRAVFIEVKGEGDGLKRVEGFPDQSKEINSLYLLHRLGFDVELWWVLPEGKKAGRVGFDVDPRLLDAELPEVRPEGAPGIDWGDVRKRAVDAIPRRNRSSPCECKVPCLGVTT